MWTLAANTHNNARAATVKHKEKLQKEDEGPTLSLADATKS